MTTKELEDKLYFGLWRQGTYMCFEVAMPNLQGRKRKTIERVDMLSYDTSGTWRFFELKISKKDFHSKNKVTFLGHYNYYVLPKSLYDSVKEEIPDWVGVYVATEDSDDVFCIKLPKRQELKIPHDNLMFNFMQALSRENQKYRKYLKTKRAKKPTERGLNKCF